jgi:Mrp family chromosome partitioning ATPase/capsular polysaccharide biosynthesis protein
MEQPTSPQEYTETVELSDYFRVLWARKWLVVAIVALTVGVVAALTFTTTPQYRATATLVREKTTLETALFGSRLFEYRDIQRELRTSAGLATTPEVAALVKTELGSERSAEELSGMANATPGSQTDIIDITASSSDPAEAADVANSFARNFIAVQQRSDREAIALAEQVIRSQLNRMTTAELTSDRGRLLTGRLEELTIMAELQTGGFKITQPAMVPRAPFTPQPVRNLILALAVGLVLGVGLAFLVEYLDRRIKDETGLEREFGLPVLSTVPLVGGKWDPRKRDSETVMRYIGFSDPRSPLLEPFRTLRSSLQYFGVDEQLRVLLVTSGLPREGKSVVVANLGISLALSGRRVIAAETDLRKPMLHNYFGLTNEVGVSSVVAGTHSLAEALQLVPVDDYAPPAGRRTQPGDDGLLLQKNLYCLTSGPLPPNPAELLSSGKMLELVERMLEAADYVILDTPPVLLVADALTLAKHVDGVLVSARMGATTKDEAREVRSLLDRAGARPIGIVAQGSKRSGAYYRYGYRRYGGGYSGAYEGYGYGP